MRGHTDAQPGIFHYFQPEDLIPAEHPLRRIKAWADDALHTLEPVFREMYSARGRPSVPPEQLLKSQLLIAFYSVRSDRLFCEQLAYNFLFRWFLDLAPEAGLLSDEHFSVDGTLIEAWASLKSFRPTARHDREPPPDDPGNPTVNF